MDGDAVRALRHFREYHYIEAGINRSEVSTKTERLQAQLDLERLEKESALARLKTERMESELNVARRVQMSLLPAEPPGVERLDIASTCIPALEVGGDYYDFFQFSEHQLAVAIGDITGKGIPAAIQMTLVKGVLLSHAICDATPKSVLVEINRHLYANLRRGWFASMIYATIDTLSMRLRYASAGHNPLLVIRNGVVISPERPRGMALGLAPGSIFAPGLEEYEIALAAGDVIVFYTDGYSEAMNESREEYGEDRLHTSAAQHSILSEASSIIESIGTDIVTFIGAAEQHDDMTMIGMKLI
jgi:serine phosphatase RsbU (regulator of sigma subunit)